MNQKIKEAIDLLEKAKKSMHYQSVGFDYIDQALTLLKQQPTAGDFTKEFRKFIEHPLTTLRLKRWHTKSREACDIIDRAEARLKDLLVVGKVISLALKKIKKTQKIDPFYLDTLIAVLDNAILKQLDYQSPVEGETDNPDPLPAKQGGN